MLVPLIRSFNLLFTRHVQVKEQLSRFENMSPTDPEFDSTIKSLMEDLKEHIREEEQEDLPKLEEALEKTYSEDLAKSFQRTKMFVPTHSHPMAPSRPPFETVAGLMAAPIDKLRDMFRKFPKDE
jgi:hypothetical protein